MLGMPGVSAGFWMICDMCKGYLFLLLWLSCLDRGSWMCLEFRWMCLKFRWMCLEFRWMCLEFRWMCLEFGWICLEFGFAGLV